MMNLSEMRSLNRQNGGHWFDRGTMRFFASKVETPANDEGYFVTSEKTGPDSDERRFTVRKIDLETGAVDTVGDFLAYETKQAAKDAIMALYLTDATRR